MWKKTVTIDKSYGKECRALLRELGKNKSLVCAVEESKTRILISVAARDADGENAQEYLCDKITKLLTTYFKHLYITESIGIDKFTPAQVCLLAVMVYYDSEAEYAELFDKISGYDVICIDGVYNFAMKNLKEVEDMNFAYTNISLNKSYDMSYRQALQMIERNGGKITEKDVTISCQSPVPVRYEKSFEGLYPIDRQAVNKDITKFEEVTVEEATGVVFKGHVRSSNKEYVAKVEMYMDGELVETANLPVDHRVRRHDLFWKYQIPKGKHTFTFKWLNPEKNVTIFFGNVLVYSDAPRQVKYQ